MNEVVEKAMGAIFFSLFLVSCGGGSGGNGPSNNSGNPNGVIDIVCERTVGRWKSDGGRCAVEGRAFLPFVSR